MVSGYIFVGRYIQHAKQKHLIDGTSNNKSSVSTYLIKNVLNWVRCSCWEWRGNGNLIIAPISIFYYLYNMYAHHLQHSRLLTPKFNVKCTINIVFLPSQGRFDHWHRRELEVKGESKGGHVTIVLNIDKYKRVGWGGCGTVRRKDRGIREDVT